jgi:hypothetical protein
MANHELISQIAKAEGPEGISQASPKVEVVEGVSLTGGLQLDFLVLPKCFPRFGFQLLFGLAFGAKHEDGTLLRSGGIRHSHPILPTSNSPSSKGAPNIY